MLLKKLLALLCIFMLSLFTTTLSIASSEIYVWSPITEPLNSVETNANIANSIKTNTSISQSVGTDLNLQCGGAVLM